MSDVYRVTVKSTSSLQPQETFWNHKVLYCGTDRDAARVAYHESTPDDGGHGNYGNSCRDTVMEVLIDGETSDFSDDHVGTCA